MIAGPFNGKLAARTRESLSGRPLAPAGGIYVDIILVLINELKKLCRDRSLPEMFRNTGMDRKTSSMDKRKAIMVKIMDSPRNCRTS